MTERSSETPNLLFLVTDDQHEVQDLRYGFLRVTQIRPPMVTNSPEKRQNFVCRLFGENKLCDCLLIFPLHPSSFAIFKRYNCLSLRHTISQPYSGFPSINHKLFATTCH
jgi:hypothetical protein